MNKNDKWGNDIFTKMVREYGEKIDLISKRVEKEISESLNNSEEINLFVENVDKKKSRKEKIINSQDNTTPVISSDTGVVYMSDDEVSNLDNYSFLLEDTDDDFGEININKYQQKVLKNIAEPYVNKFMKKTGKNFARVGIEFLMRGPGLTNYNLFDGILDIAKESLNTDFVDRIGEIYEKDFRFRKAYFSVMNQWKNKNTNIDEELINIAVNYDEADNREKILLRNTLNMVAILLSSKYKNIIEKELNNFYAYSKIPKLLKILAINLNRKIDPSKDITRQAAEILLEFDENYNILESDLRPISNLYFMVSSAISLSTFRRVNYKETEKGNIIKINKYIINKEEFLNNTRNNNNSRIIRKYGEYLDKQVVRESFFKLVDTIENNFDDKLKMQESLLDLEENILKIIEDKTTGYPELDSARNNKKILTIFYGIN